MNPRQHAYDAITPLKDGQPPGFIVACLDCDFGVDAHALTAEDAVKAVAPTHDERHHLIARPVDYTKGHGPKQSEPHPLYRR